MEAQLMLVNSAWQKLGPVIHVRKLLKCRHQHTFSNTPHVISAMDAMWSQPWMMPHVISAMWSQPSMPHVIPAMDATCDPSHGCHMRSQPWMPCDLSHGCHMWSQPWMPHVISAMNAMWSQPWIPHVIPAIDAICDPNPYQCPLEFHRAQF